MCVGGPPNPIAPMRPHSRATTARPGAGGGVSTSEIQHGPEALRRATTRQPRPLVTSAAMGEEQRLSAEEQLATAREAFEAGTDFTVAVEEEFALLDPDTLVARQPVRGPAGGGARAPTLEPAPRRRADRLRGRGAHRQVRRLRRGAPATMARAPRAAPGARARARAPARRAPARIRGRAGRTSGSSTRRTTGGTTSSSATSSGATTPSGCTCTSGSAAATARSPSATRCAASCPSCSRSRRARRSSRRSTPACTRRARRSSRACSRAAGSRTPTTAGAASRTTSRSSTGRGSITEHTQLWWSVRPHLAYPTVEIRICDAPARPRRVAEPRRARRTRSPRAARARIDEGEPLPDLPNRLLEENLWRAIRYGLPGELIDFDRGEPVPGARAARAAVEWVAPVAEEIGAAPFLAVPAANAAERQLARWHEGASLEEIYAEQVEAGERIG